MMNELIELILDYGQECEDRDMSSSNTFERIKSRLESLEKDVIPLNTLLQWSSIAAEGKSLALQMEIDQFIIHRATIEATTQANKENNA